MEKIIVNTYKICKLENWSPTIFRIDGVIEKE